MKGESALKGLRALRKSKDLSQEELAELLGVSSRQVCRWETGTSKPRLDLIPEICGVLGCSLEQLLWGVPEAA